VCILKQGGDYAAYRSLTSQKRRPVGDEMEGEAIGIVKRARVLIAEFLSLTRFKQQLG
jgi:hypothetical protein